MRNLLTNEQMRAVDSAAMKFVPALELMERAGRAVFERVKALLEKEREKGLGGKVVCVCGGGNNGGDGFVVARYLLREGYAVAALCRAKRFSEEARVNREKFLSLGGEIVEDFSSEPPFLIVDCLLGTGFSGEVREDVAALISFINACKKKGAYVLSVDVPSGINGDNGAGEIFVRANETTCVGEEKLGVRLQNGLDAAGRVCTLDIGLKGFSDENYVKLLEDSDARALLPDRRRNSHKGVCGKVAILGGSKEYSGAGYLSALSASKSGVGYTAWFLPEELLKAALFKLPEVLLVSTNEGGRYEFNEEICEKLCAYDAIALGMGLGATEDVYKTILYLFERYAGRLILDADGLNAISKFGGIDDFLRIKQCDVAITPHLKELSRLANVSVTELVCEPLRFAKEITERYRLTLLWKGASTLVVKSGETVLSVTGSSAQAKGGSGDVLSGLIGGLCAQGLSSFDAAAAGAYVFGRAAELAGAERSEYSATPVDFVEKFGEALKSLK